MIKINLLAERKAAKAKAPGGGGLKLEGFSGGSNLLLLGVLEELLFFFLEFFFFAFQEGLHLFPQLFFIFFRYGFLDGELVAAVGAFYICCHEAEFFLQNKVK